MNLTCQAWLELAFFEELNEPEVNCLANSSKAISKLTLWNTLQHSIYIPISVDVNTQAPSRVLLDWSVSLSEQNVNMLLIWKAIKTKQSPL